MEPKFNTVLEKDLEIGHIYYDFPGGVKFEYVEFEDDGDGGITLFKQLSKHERYSKRTGTDLVEFAYEAYGKWFEPIKE